VPILAGLIGGCGLYLGPAPVPPAGVSASTGLEARVELSWEEVASAGVYYVYRAAFPDDPSAEFAFLGQTAVPAFVDTEVDKIPYGYYVTAASPDGSSESAPSETAEGSPSLSRSWEDLITLALGAGVVSPAMDSTSGTLYAGYAGAGAASDVLLAEENAEEGLEDLVPAAGSVDTGAASGGAVAIAVSDDRPVIAYADALQGGRLTLREFLPPATDGEDGSWQTLGGAGFTDGLVDRLALERFKGNWVAAFAEGASERPRVAVYDGSSTTVIDIDSELGLGSSPNPIAASLALARSDDYLYLAYERRDSTDPPADDQSRLILAHSADGLSWSPGIPSDPVVDVLPGGGRGDLRDGVLSLGASEDERVYIAYVARNDAAGLGASPRVVVLERVSTGGNDRSPASFSLSTTPDSVALGLDDLGGEPDTLYLFTRTADDVGIVLQRNEADGVWRELADRDPDGTEVDLTAASPSGLGIAVRRNEVLVGYVTAAGVQARVFR
jgi:hypothetical protein